MRSKVSKLIAKGGHWAHGEHCKQEHYMFSAYKHCDPFEKAAVLCACLCFFRVGKKTKEDLLALPINENNITI